MSEGKKWLGAAVLVVLAIAVWSTQLSCAPRPAPIRRSTGEPSAQAQPEAQWAAIGWANGAGARGEPRGDAAPSAEELVRAVSSSLKWVESFRGHGRRADLEQLVSAVHAPRDSGPPRRPDPFTGQDDGATGARATEPGDPTPTTAPKGTQSDSFRRIQASQVYALKSRLPLRSQRGCCEAVTDFHHDLSRSERHGHRGGRASNEARTAPPERAQ